MDIDSPAKPKTAWIPPPRPDWVARLNQEGRYLDLAGVVPLDANSLINTAVANTGLDNFGSDDWREPFEVLVKSYNEESQLTLIGRIMTRSELLMFLEARLRVEEQYRLHPEIEEQQIKQPFWVLGQGRSGTSMLQTLLGLDPASRTIVNWEAMFPVKLPGAGPDRRIEIGDARIKQWVRVAPEIAAMHEFAGDAQTETHHFESMSFQTPGWLNMLGMVPSYSAYMAKRSYEPSFLYARRVFKLMQWQKPGRHWVFKNADSLNYLPDLMKVFPDVRLVWSHRDPIKAMASAISILSTIIWIRSDQRFGPGAFDFQTDPQLLARSLIRPIEFLESGLIPKDQLCNIQYLDLVKDPLATVGSVYEFFGMEFSGAARAAISDYLTANPRTARPPHSYAASAEQVTAADRAALKQYQDYFRVPSEV